MTVSSRHRMALSTLALSVVTACTSIPITSYPKLASLDPETMDLRDVEIGVRLQDDFGIIQDSVILNVSLAHRETGDIIQEQIILQESPEPLTEVLESKLKSGFQVHRYRMDAATGAAVTDYRAEVLARRDAEPGDQHEGTFAANVGLCMKPGGNPLIDPRMTLYLKTAPDKTFFTMFKETKLPLPRDEQNRPKSCADNEAEAN